MGKSLFLSPSAGGGCWMSEHKEEKAGDLFAIALHLDHRCTAPEIQPYSKLHGIFNLLILATILLAFYYPKTTAFSRHCSPWEKENLYECPKPAFCEAEWAVGWAEQEISLLPQAQLGSLCTPGQMLTCKGCSQECAGRDNASPYSRDAAACVIRVICCG